MRPCLQAARNTTTVAAYQYPPGLHDAFAAVADLRESPRLIDVGCGPGTVALRLADLFAEVVGVDADRGMIDEAIRAATGQNLTNAQWFRLLAEQLPAGLGAFRMRRSPSPSTGWAASWLRPEFSTCWSLVALSFMLAGRRSRRLLPSIHCPIRCLQRMKFSGLSIPTSGLRPGPARESSRMGRRAASGMSCGRRASKRPQSLASPAGSCWSEQSMTSWPRSSLSRAAHRTCLVTNWRTLSATFEHVWLLHPTSAFSPSRYPISRLSSTADPDGLLRWSFSGPLVTAQPGL